MCPRPPISPLPDSLFPYPTLFRSSPQSAIHARRRVDHGADHPCLYRMVLVGVSRKGWRGWVSLMAARMKRIGWFIAIWAASVAAIGAVGLIIRAVLRT